MPLIALYRKLRRDGLEPKVALRIVAIYAARKREAERNFK